MGSGKRNYRAMRYQYRNWDALKKAPKNKEKEEQEKKEPKKEDVDALIELWEKNQKKMKVNENKS